MKTLLFTRTHHSKPVFVFKTLLVLCFAFSCFFTSNLALAETQKEDVATSQVSKKLANIFSFQGEFKQIISDEDDFVVEENEGEFLLKRPGFFRWYIKPPFEKLLVSNNKTLWTYDPELKQATAEAVDDNLMQTPMLLLSGEVELIQATYSVKKNTKLVSGFVENFSLQKTVSSYESYRLTLKEDDGLFEWMDIIFAGDAIVGMVLSNALGETQYYYFSKTEQNKTIDDAKFQFDIPADVDVIVND